MSISPSATEQLETAYSISPVTPSGRANGLGLGSRYRAWSASPCRPPRGRARALARVACAVRIALARAAERLARHSRRSAGLAEYPAHAPIERSFADHVLPGPFQGHPRLDDRGNRGDVEILRGQVLQTDLRQLGLQLALGLFDREVGVDRVELDEQLARLDPIAHIMMDLEDASLALAADSDVLPSH